MRRRMMGGAISVVLLAGAWAGWMRWHTGRYDEMVSLAAARHELDFYLVKALIFEESWFRPSARGTSGEVGLMQVTLAAATDYTNKLGYPEIGESLLIEPGLNLEIGCWYLRRSLDRYRDSPNPTLFALLRYNAGAARADTWLKAALSQPVPAGMLEERHYLSLVDIPGTREYARRILKRSRSRNFWY